MGLGSSDNVGYNSDWSVAAWKVGPGRPNYSQGAMYILDNEDGKAQLVRRWYPDQAGDRAEPMFNPDDGTEVEVLKTVPATEEGLRKLVRIAKSEI